MFYISKKPFIKESGYIMALIKCSECSTEVSDRAATCVKCGCPLVNKGASPAVHSGASFAGNTMRPTASSRASLANNAANSNHYYARQSFDDDLDEFKSHKNWDTLLILSILIGELGADRFYAGQTGIGLLKLFTTLFCAALFWLILPLFVIFTWWIIDIVMAASGKFRDSEGRYITKG
jgi:TM2 domain-containing membrane protein YozV